MRNLKNILKKAVALMVFKISHQKQLPPSLRPTNATMPILFILLGGLLANTAWGGAQGITFTGDYINSTDVYVGNTGTGTLTLSGGATLSDTQGNVGFSTGSNGTMNINYGTWTNSATLFNMDSWICNLSINGGNASTTYASVGLQAILNSQSTEYFTKKKLS